MVSLGRACLRVAGAGGALGAALTVGALAEARAPVQRIVHVDVPGVTMRGLRILQIADMHLHARASWQVQWLQSLPQLQPDLVLVTGDNLSDPTGWPLLRRALEPLRGVAGAFVFGSNDYFSAQFSTPLRYARPILRNIATEALGMRRPPGSAAAARRRQRSVPDLPHQEMAEFFQDLGWVDLRNAATCMHVTPLLAGTQAGLRVALVGVDDPHINHDAEPCPGPGWDEADLRLGVVHAPYARVLDQLTALGTDLIIAGHTHGGQVCLPVGRALVNNTDIPLRYASGLHTWRLGTVADPKPHVRHGILRPTRVPQPTRRDSALLYVSRGLGTSKYAPIRLFCRPETNLLVVE